MAVDCFEEKFSMFILQFVSAVAEIDQSLLSEPTFVKWFSQMLISED